jgi:hypothetical protein
MPVNSVGALPPVGSRGLPLTLVFTDEIDDTITDASGSRMALFDEAIWKARNTQALNVSGTTINPQPVVPSATSYSASQNPFVDMVGFNTTPRASGLRINISPPAFNHNRGHLLFGQIGQDVSKSRHDDSKLTSTMSFAGLSKTECGQYTDHPEQSYASGRPANHTWQKSQAETIPFLYRTQYDMAFGNTLAAGSSTCTESTFQNGGQVEAIVHDTIPAIPSNGLGIIYGDNHNSEYLTTIVSSPLAQTANNANTGMNTAEWLPSTPAGNDDTKFSSNWCVNLLNQQPFVLSTDATPKRGISSPDGTLCTSTDNAEQKTQSFSIGTSTIQHILTDDVFSDGTVVGEPLVNTPLGRVDLGASVVGDSVGLIGFEGVITATAFFAPTKNTDPAGTLGPVSNTDPSRGYAGLNIQVSSGTPMRRNGSKLMQNAPYKYGSDGAIVMPMSDALSTMASRATGVANSATTNANKTWFRNTQFGQGMSGLTPTPIIGDSTSTAVGLSGVQQVGAGGGAGGIIGSNTVGGSDPATIDSSYSTGRWIADGIPTKVEIIPIITGYKDVQVSVGASKLALHPSATPITFRKPLVDYHVVVSVVKPHHVPNASADTTAGKTNIGTPNARNDPRPNRLHIDADFSDTPATLYHGIFRIDPQTLEQIFIDPIAGGLAGITNATEYGCSHSVLPREDFSRAIGGEMTMGWGLHQTTPFRPLALADTNTKVPDLCAAVEGGGSFQRGGISHLWDATAFGGELFVGADVIDPKQMCVATTTIKTPSGNRTQFGIWGNGQVWPDGSLTPTRPKGCELLIWRYSSTNDPLYPTTSLYLSNPIRDGFPAAFTPYVQSTHDNMTRLESNKIKASQRKTALGIGAVWEIHDWVMPQLEMMRYLGREEKFSTAHPKSEDGIAGGSRPMFHPTLHCSSLRATDEGKFTMAAVHIDYIKTENDYPAVDIKYPLNPDLDTGGCPAGYYQSGGKCIPMSGVGDYPTGFGPDPQSGDTVPNNNNVPSPVNGSGGSTPKSDNFSAYPTWSKLMANTQARSLILMFSDIGFDKDTGLAVRGKALFDCTFENIKVATNTVDEIATQTWAQADTWWSGARIAYWYQESGQRAIPITYGSYPDCRMSYANLPRSLPFLINTMNPQEAGDPILGVAKIQSGFPTVQPAIVAQTTNPIWNTIRSNGDPTELASWSDSRQKFLMLTRYVPTTIGFSDFGAGANPHQELGWSGWSFPKGLYDPIGYGDNTVFFSDAPEVLDTTGYGVQITPTEQAIFKGFGDNADDVAGSNTYAPLAARYVDLSSVSFPATVSSLIVYKVGEPQQERLIAGPQGFGSIAELAAVLTNPAFNDFMTMYDPEYQASSGFVGFQELPANFIARTYDPNAPPPIESANQMVWTSITINGVVHNWEHTAGTGHRLMSGGKGGWSHHGPLHYGVSTRFHPYRVDRVFKQVHGGVGYNLPIHLLKPPAVHVRARAGGKNAIELEMETPFHRTDNIHLLSAGGFNAGHDKGGQSPPNASRPVQGQYFLRTNLWDKPTWGSVGVSGSLITPLAEVGARVHGPIVSGSFGLEAFWSDHPTDHFHASAMPIMPNTDYDLSMIESNRYSPLMFARNKEIHELDVLAISEQLQSSVDVHVSQSAKPMWDSGSIASAVGMGFADAFGLHMIQRQSSMDGNSMAAPATASGGSGSQCMGMGQRQLRTPDGTLHQFFIRRSCQTGSGNLPQWTHIKKPLWGDLFWNRKATKPQQKSAVFGGEDECGPILASIGAGLTTPADYDKGRVMGAAFASDSAGTIHAVIEYHANPDDTANHRAHRLYYHKATRKSCGSQPEPIYDWDWSVHTPVLLQGGTGWTTTQAGGTMWDLRMPSLVCDGDDRLHLAFQQVLSQVGASGLPVCSRIFYTSKLPDEDSFPTWTPVEANQAKPYDNRFVCVHDIITDAGQTTLNQASAGPHYTTYNDCPKVVLRGDNIPVVFYRGQPIQSFATADRNYNAIYCNIGQSPNRVSDPSGRFTFDSTKSFHVVGLGPDSKNPLELKNVVYYDAIIDERDRAIVLSTKDDRETSPAVYAPRQTLITTFDSRVPLVDQYSATDGLGTHITLWRGPVYDGTTELRKVDPAYRNVSLTTDGKGNIHVVMGFSMIGDDPTRFGEVYRDASSPKARQSALAPLIWAATPTGKENVSGVETPYAGGFIKPTIPPNWSGLMTPPYPPYQDSQVGREYQHLLHAWIPSLEFDTTHNTLRSVNIRWLSVPSLRWDQANNTWSPVGSAQTMAGEEDFPHHSSQLRFQRFWGYDASEIDLRWFTNEMAWYSTNTKGSEVYYPSKGGIQMELGDSIEGGGEGLAGYPNG